MKYEWRDGNQIDLLINGEDFFPAVFESIRNARQQVLLETFIIFEDKIGMELQQALIAAARNGAEVEITVDGYGTADLSTEYVAALVAAGVRVHMFDPGKRLLGMRTNLFRRLHRKIVVVDNEVAYIGGINYGEDHIADYGPMAKQDYAVRVRGPIVADLHTAAVRLLDARDDRPATPHRGSQPGQHRHAGNSRLLMTIRDNGDDTNTIEQHYLDAIRNAQHRLIIANAYFFPGYRLLRELRNAARRGVKVTLILQGMPDMPLVRLCSRLTYNYLLRDGVTIYEYCQRPLHGKVALADHEWCTIGSSNLDPLSLSLNLEANVIVRDAALNRRLHEHLSELAESSCKSVPLKRVMRGYWWRAPLIFLCFHFLRHFPAIAGWFPAHSPRIKLLKPEIEAPQCGTLQVDQEKVS
ncbi:MULTISPECIES: cardiolipin synthase ClsB [Pseudomonas]|uniref:Cardiolipin synthase B n=1 Tax=Pseudomonas fulva (strain 12-X) TaxID=743720 RepID=F6AI10_PSEF1|nr:MULTISPECIES: cardiolipin synthase ClsB [Pseudomonas]AEF22766.1 phospholipase D/Transphosphatidylase [Pseudomonas fulva 12-X]MBD9399037.1 cardiolipin synthase ClsB [Pseudomonas sp. PDM11]MBV7564737.1 cardiolipin synthase ClsB [Pseudomonas sp. sia0905]PZW69916.1 cardiolipin synthase [Pseudomonas sp. URMO17WK12:I1]TWE05706.1 cardiolipin synthase [Pseudomonas sp. AG1028]